MDVQDQRKTNAAAVACIAAPLTTASVAHWPGAFTPPSRAASDGSARTLSHAATRHLAADKGAGSQRPAQPPHPQNPHVFVFRERRSRPRAGSSNKRFRSWLRTI